MMIGSLTRLRKIFWAGTVGLVCAGILLYSVHLRRHRHVTPSIGFPDVEAELLSYPSQIDGSMQSVRILRPAGKAAAKLFFFFHAMTGDPGDAVKVKDLVTKLDGMVVAPAGRGPSWVSDAFCSDAEQVIRKYAASFSGYYLIGISMGGTQALALAGLLPADLRKSLMGVLAIIPGSDLVAIAEGSSAENVRAALRASVGTGQDRLKTRSPDQLISEYPPGLPFAIFYPTEDTVLDAPTLKNFIEHLRSSGHPTSVFTTPGEHSFGYKDFGYEEFFNSLGQNSNHFEVPASS